MGTDDFFYMLLSFYFFFCNFYVRLKRLLLDPELLDSSSGINSPSDLTWDFIISKMSLLTKKMYKVDVKNSLPTLFHSYTFPNITRRYMFKSVLSAAKNNHTALAVIGTGLVGGGVGFVLNDRRRGQYLAIREQEARTEAALKQAEIDEQKLFFDKEQYFQKMQEKSAKGWLWSPLGGTFSSKFSFFDFF